ncbi:MAG: RidA family protein [Prolixibacteraceae bacterium]|jgi:enamine deaminase RidA (YjgF/YER057c/UK114 family)|nr:RidA family protein [Prolixibacteraceae bacterium]
MKILGGNQVVFYSSRTGSYDVQLSDCLEQLEEYMDENQIYSGSFIRHNIFIDPYESSIDKSKLISIAKRRFPMPLIINVIPHAPAEGQVALESTHVKSTQWNCLFKEEKNGSCQHIVDGKSEVVVGAVQVEKAMDFQASVEKAFSSVESLLVKCNMNFENIVKQWNYIGRMFDNELNVQHYQIFNDIRTKYYENDFEKTGYPASTEIGVHSDGILIEFFAVKNAGEVSKLVNNPIQKAPHEYSSKVLSKRGVLNLTQPTTPKVERARYFEFDQQKMIFISATAAIAGERVTHAGDVKEQTVIVVENLKRIVSDANLSAVGIEKSGDIKYTLVKAYVQNKSDFNNVYSVLEPYFANIPLLLVQADLPRKDILVELEAEVLL